MQGIHNQRFVTVHSSGSATANEPTTDGKNNNNNNLESFVTLVDCVSDAERETERLAWRRTLGEILPASFRIGKDVPDYHQTKLTRELEALLQQAATYVPPPPAPPVEEEVDNTGVVGTGVGDNDSEELVAVPPPLLCDPRAGPLPEATVIQLQRLEFLPHAYQMGLDRSTIRKNPALEPLHAWLKQQVASGAVTRQETVSMVPPILLSVVSTDHVLDMCAAPGSKTSQLLEDLSCNKSSSTTVGSNEFRRNTNNATATGFDDTNNNENGGGVLVANDASAARAYMLVHQLRRILHNHPVALITACPAQFFASGILQFDKILCDVPCTGDGTTRKNIGIWKTWSASSGLALHALQLSIALKGAAQLLKQGGLMVYSTCSFNPVENEAVVAELLRQSNGALELVDYGLDCRHGDVSDGAENFVENLNTSHTIETSFPVKQNTDHGSGPLRGFKTRPGLSNWKILCEDLTERQRKNQYKKQSAKMQAKRKAFQAETEGIESTAIDDMSQAAASANNKSDTPSSERCTVDDRKAEKKKFEPTSLDESSLLAMAETEGLRYYNSMQDVPDTLKKRIRATVFPPTMEEAASFHLERCLRCLPHDNNTGGFFVALLRKTGPWSAVDRRYQKKQQQESATTHGEEPETKRARGESSDAILENGTDENLVRREDPEEDFNNVSLVEEFDNEESMEEFDVDTSVVEMKEGMNNEAPEDFGKDDFAAVADDIMEPLIEHYGLSSGFDKGLYMSRACSECKVIYFVARPVKRLFELGIQKRVPIVNTGLKGFMRNNRNVAECAVSYRVCQEGVHFLAPYMKKRLFLAGVNDFRVCLSGEGKTIHLSQFSENFRVQIAALSPGSFVVVLEGYEDTLDQKLVLCMWKCRGESVDGLVAKVEVDGILSKLDSIDQPQSRPKE